MENINPGYNYLVELRFALKSGESIVQFLPSYLANNGNNTMSISIQNVFNRWRLGLNQELSGPSMGPYRLQILKLTLMGLEGHQIGPALDKLEVQYRQACDLEFSKRARIAPVLGLLITSLFSFPSLLILILGPMVNFFNNWGGKW